MMRHLFATPGNPVRLVKPGEDGSADTRATDTQPGEASQAGTVQADRPAASPALQVATNWWIMTPVLLVAVAAALTLHLQIRRARTTTPQERAFRALAKAARVPTKHRVLARRLADAPGAPPPVAVLLSDGALATAAARIETKPGSSTDKVLTEYLAIRGVDDPRRAHKAGKAKADGGRLRRSKSKGTGRAVDTAA